MLGWARNLTVSLAKVQKGKHIGYDLYLEIFCCSLTLNVYRNMVRNVCM